MGSKTKRRKFKGGASRNAEKQAQKPQHRHLNLPKGLSVWKETPKTRVNIDILLYEVKDKIHPDRDEEYGIAMPGELWYKRPYLIHKNIGPNNDAIVCPGTNKQPCPICEHRAQLLKDGADWDEDAVKALKHSQRNLYLIVPLGQKDYDEEPHIWDMSQYLFQDKLDEELKENEEHDSFPDLEDGSTLRIRFGEDSYGKNKFAMTSRIDFVERDRNYPDSILDELPSLDDVIVIPSYKSIEAIFFSGMSADEVEDLDEDEPEDKPTTRRKRRPEPEPEEDEEEDEPEPPKRTRKRQPEPEPEEEEDEPEEDEPEEKPKPKKKDKGSGKGKCPHQHEFGMDNDMFDECDNCDEWDACAEAGG